MGNLDKIEGITIRKEIARFISRLVVAMMSLCNMTVTIFFVRLSMSHEKEIFILNNDVISFSVKFQNSKVFL